MTDWVVALVSVLALGFGLGACVMLHRAGLATTYVRDVLHVGTAVWVLAWPLFHGRIAPFAIVIGAAVLTFSVPLLSRASSVVAHFHDTFAAGDERWTGLSLYTLAYAVLTCVGMLWDPYPAAAGLFALSLGDGVGGFVGRKFGRHKYRAPGAKDKSIEGSLAVALFAAAGVLLAGWRFGASVSLPEAAGLGVGAAIAEAVSPRGTDNVIVPAVVFCLAEVSS